MTATKKTTKKGAATPTRLAGAASQVKENRKRTRLLVIRLNDAEREMIEHVAEHHGMNATQMIRQLVRRENDRIRAAMGDRR